MSERVKTDLVVIGGGPGGYVAAFTAADLGMDVVLVDRRENPGGVCLYEGCIPSKALLHAAKILEESREAEKIGIHFEKPKIDLEKLRTWKEKGVVQKLTGGLGVLGKKRKVCHIRGVGSFNDAHSLTVRGEDGESKVTFQRAIIATGSLPIHLPGYPEDSPRVWDSTAALELREIPEKLLVVGGGYIGLELGSVYASLGSRVTVAEMADGLIPGADRDLVRPLAKRLEERFESIHTGAKATFVSESDSKVTMKLEREGSDPVEAEYDAVLVAVGRRPSVEGLDLEKSGLSLNDRGFIEVDERRRTSKDHIAAIGDVAAGTPLLAHVASHEAKIAVESFHGEPAAWDVRAIPAVVFTDPEIAWCGLTETDAKKKEVEVKVLRFHWAASGRALTLGATDGLTKLLVEPETGRLLGGAVVGAGAGELITEIVLAVEMGARAEDLKLTIHPHPTLTETWMEAAESFFGQATHIYKG